MVLVHRDRELEQMEFDSRYNGGFDSAIVKRIRRCLQHLRAAKDERDLNAVRSYHFEKLKGDRSHQHSIRVNDQWRMILEIDGKVVPRTIYVIGVEDYH